MNVKMQAIKNIVLPYKKINYFMLGIIIFGIISGSIFFTIISKEDKVEIIKQVNLFFNNISTSSIDSGLALKNAIFSNGILIIIIWLLGLSVIGLFVNIFIVYIKSFVVGFSVASIIGVYGLKGVIAAFIYVFPQQIIDLIAVLLMGIYSVIFSFYLIKLIIQKKGLNNRNMFKKYMLIFVISVIIVVIGALFEAFFLPAIMKLIINLYV